MSYLEKTFFPHLRLTILRVLNSAPDKRANASMLADACTVYGLGTTREQVRDQLRWLEEKALVVIDEIGAADLMVAHLTESGSYVAEGKRKIDGIKQPNNWAR